MNTLVNEVEAIAECVFERKFAEVSRTPHEVIGITHEASALRDKLACINAKEHISIAEAALLLNCSDGHIRNLVGKARKRQSQQPIPFTDLDGVTVFNRLALLEWASTPKHRLKVIKTKDKTSRG